MTVKAQASFWRTREAIELSVLALTDCDSARPLNLADSYVFYFPPEHERVVYYPEKLDKDLWLLIAPHNAHTAFSNFGPFESNNGVSEPARYWQDGLQQFRELANWARFASNHEKIEPTTSPPITKLRSSIEQDINAGHLICRITNGTVAPVSTTIGSWLRVEAWKGLTGGPLKIDRCDECKRILVQKVSGRMYCSKRCALRAHRARQKHE
jgi:hypothetical protein